MRLNLTALIIIHGRESSCRRRRRRHRCILRAHSTTTSRRGNSAWRSDVDSVALPPGSPSLFPPRGPFTQAHATRDRVRAGVRQRARSTRAEGHKTSFVLFSLCTMGRTRQPGPPRVSAPRRLAAAPTTPPSIPQGMYRGNRGRFTRVHRRA